MAYQITYAEQSRVVNSDPPILESDFEILLDDTTIAGTDAEIDAEIPEVCRVPGTIVYSADYSVIKTRNLDGEWVEKS